MAKCPNCFKEHSDVNFEDYCDPCYEDIYLAYGEDPNRDADVNIVKDYHPKN